eukprot:5170511-Karenia_brevis.AAC.1
MANATTPIIPTIVITIIIMVMVISLSSGYPASSNKARVLRIWKLDMELGGDGSYIFAATVLWAFR